MTNARKAKSQSHKTGLYHAREAHGMRRTELVKRPGVSKQQLSPLENGLIGLRLDRLKPFANPSGYPLEQIMLWGPSSGTGGDQPNGEVSAAKWASPGARLAFRTRLRRKRREGGQSH